MYNFENFKVNCSQIGSLMGNAKDNKPPTQSQIQKLFATIGRDYGELSEAMKHNAREILTKWIDYEPGRPSKTILSEMVLLYCYEMYGKSKIPKGNDSPHQLEKGSLAEPESIKLLSKTDGVEYVKNNELFENKWFKGIPDIILRKESGKITKIIEIKTSYDLPSFIMSKRMPEHPDNVYQVMGYMDLTGCKEAEIVHCLVDMPEQIVSFEEKRLRERYNLLEIDQLEIESRIGNHITNMEYSEIPDELKIFRRSFTKNTFTVKAVKSRVTMSKKWMKEIHECFTENAINLSETETDNQQDSI